MKLTYIYDNSLNEVSPFKICYLLVFYYIVQGDGFQKNSYKVK